MATRRIIYPRFALTHPEVKYPRPNEEGKVIWELIEFTFERYLLILLSDAWWKAGNENEALARTEACLRLLEGVESARESPEEERSFDASDADLSWLIQRAQAWHPQGTLAPLAPKILRFFRVLLRSNLAPETADDLKKRITRTMQVPSPAANGDRGQDIL